MSASAEVVTPAVAPAVASQRYLRAKLGSFIGLFPLGIWTAAHLWSNLAAFDGERHWARAVTVHANWTGDLLGFAALVIFLLWHTVWGLKRMAEAHPNGYAERGNLRWWLQRLSALGLLGFLGAHLWLAKLHPLLTTGHPESFQDMASHMAHHLPTLVVYLLGIAAVAYHLGNGLWNFTFSFGLVTSQRGLSRMTWVAGLLVVALLALGWLAVFALWQAGQPFPVPID